MSAADLCRYTPPTFCTLCTVRIWQADNGEREKSPTVLCVLVLGVREGEIGVGPAGEARAAAGLGVAAAP